MPKYRSTLPSKKIADELDYLWEQFQCDSEIQAEAKQLGLDTTQVIKLPRVEAIATKPAAAHLDPATTAVIVSFSPLAAKILLDIWNNIILPRFIERNGRDSLKKVEE